jgi:hypothetical protein
MGKLLVAVVLMTCFCTGSRAADDAIPKAIDNGVKFLSKVHANTDGYGAKNFPFGSAGLVGLALLESGVAPSDPALVTITQYVRANALAQTRTYEISVAIMFLDRLGDRIDLPTIQFLGFQLLAAQTTTGGWTYTGPPDLGELEVNRLQKALYGDNRLKTAPAKNEPKEPLPKAKVPSTQVPVNVPPLHPEAARRAQWLQAEFASGRLPALIDADHSNTQFAVLALWITRKHGVPVDKALLQADKRFRSVQNKDGGWGYEINTGETSATTPPMTCSGLVALAVGRGVQRGAASDKLDAVSSAGLKFIENSISKSQDLCHNLYFLWSLERVAVIYDLDRVGELDWYKWGSEYLVKSQTKEGSWTNGGYHGADDEINTAFALLFLNRANLAKDLTATLRSSGKAKINLPDRKDTDPVKVDPKQSSDPDAEANRLSNELIKATASNRSAILAKLRDTKGSVYTEALVRAIAKLQGEQQREAREALALRLKRMTAATLRDMLKDENREVRAAAASACGLKEDKQLVVELIAVLSDADAVVVQAARNSLRSLSGKDFGPQSDASAEDKAKAITDWKAWHSSQPK